MYPLSKNKASFRIADILHQQQQTDSQLLAHHLMQVHPSEMNNLKTQSNESKKSTASKSPSPDTETSPSTKGETPQKPQPMYSNFPLPFPLGMHPAFHSAAYLNYADAIHKGEAENSLLQTLITFSENFELST